MTDSDSTLRTGAAAILGRSLTRAEAAAISGYLDLLEAWNRVHRLVGSSDRAWLVEMIVLDSLMFLSVLPEATAEILDIGSGAGVPAIPMKIVKPEMSIVMVESRRKRASFLREVVRSLGLERAEVVHGRAEELADSGRRFSAVVARCADRAEAILNLGSRLVAPGGIVAVGGSPTARSYGDTTAVRLVNPVTKSARHFLIWRAAEPKGST